MTKKIQTKAQWVQKIFLWYKEGKYIGPTIVIAMSLGLRDYHLTFLLTKK